MYACICMHVYVCMYTYACICMHVYVCMHTYACICMHAYVYMHIHACICMHACGITSQTLGRAAVVDTNPGSCGGASTTTHTTRGLRPLRLHDPGSVEPDRRSCGRSGRKPRVICMHMHMHTYACMYMRAYVCMHVHACICSQTPGRAAVVDANVGIRSSD